MPTPQPTIYPEIRTLCLSIIDCYVRNPRVGPHWMSLGVVPTAPSGSFADLCIKAIENAVKEIGQCPDIMEHRNTLRELILSSCLSDSGFKYDHMKVPMSKNYFYYYRDKFLYSIAQHLGLTYTNEMTLHPKTKSV